LFLSVAAIAQTNGFSIEEKKIRSSCILFNGKLITAYCYFDSGRKTCSISRKYSGW
jgi:hypothetical protein